MDIDFSMVEVWHMTISQIRKISHCNIICFWTCTGHVKGNQSKSLKYGIIQNIDLVIKILSLQACKLVLTRHSQVIQILLSEGWKGWEFKFPFPLRFSSGVPCSVLTQNLYSANYEMCQPWQWVFLAQHSVPITILHDCVFSAELPPWDVVCI